MNRNNRELDAKLVLLAGLFRNIANDCDDMAVTVAQMRPLFSRFERAHGRPGAAGRGAGKTVPAFSPGAGRPAAGVLYAPPALPGRLRGPAHDHGPALAGRPGRRQGGRAMTSPHYSFDYLRSCTELVDSIAAELRRARDLFCARTPQPHEACLILAQIGVDLRILFGDPRAEEPVGIIHIGTEGQDR